MYSDKKIIQILEPKDPYVVIYEKRGATREYLLETCPMIAVVNFTGGYPEAKNDPYQTIVGINFNIDGWFPCSDGAEYIETIPSKHVKDFIITYDAYETKNPGTTPESRRESLAESRRAWDVGEIKIHRIERD